MAKRFVAIWFMNVTVDWMLRCKPHLKDIPFVLAAPDHGRMLVKAVSATASVKGIRLEMTVADCRAILPQVQVMDELPAQAEKLLNALAEWCLRYTPAVAISLPNGLLLDASGCPHLWGGEEAYLNELLLRLKNFGYQVRGAMADTIGCAWAMAHFGQQGIVKSGEQQQALLPLPPAALRLETMALDRLAKLGLTRIQHISSMPRPALRVRFGELILIRLDQALGKRDEFIQPIKPIEPFQERLPSMEPIRTAKAIEIALNELLTRLCMRLIKEGKGLRTCIFKCYRVDGKIEEISIRTNRPSHHVAHLFGLLQLKIATITPAFGIELFILIAPVVEELQAGQDALWTMAGGHADPCIAELLDKLAGKAGMHAIHRYLPDEHYLPERSFKEAASLLEKPATNWRTDLPRPLHLLPQPETIEVSVPLPDYPPMLFRHKGVLHNIRKADGPERIEQEWWIEDGLYRDYYCVEDEAGARYWLFRKGSYDEVEPGWFLHGYFA